MDSNSTLLEPTSLLTMSSFCKDKRPLSSGSDCSWNAFSFTLAISVAPAFSLDKSFSSDSSTSLVAGRSTVLSLLTSEVKTFMFVISLSVSRSFMSSSLFSLVNSISLTRSVDFFELSNLSSPSDAFVFFSSTIAASVFFSGTLRSSVSSTIRVAAQ